MDKTDKGARKEFVRPGLCLSLFEHAVTEQQAKALMLALLKSVDWRANKKSGRINCTYGEPGIISAYGVQAVPWTEAPPELLIHKKLVEALSGAEANYCIVQLYVDGKVGIKPHRDKEIVSGTAISGLSLGATRILSMSRTWPKLTTLDLPLPSGSLYVLHPPTNDTWRHEIKGDAKEPEARISITYRFQPVTLIGTNAELPGGHNKYKLRSAAQVQDARTRARPIVKLLLERLTGVHKPSLLERLLLNAPPLMRD